MVPSSEGKISTIFDEILDYDALARESLATHWAGLNATQRQEFTTTLQRLVQAAYRKNLKKTLDYDVVVKGEVALDGGTLVKTTATHRSKKREAPVTIDYALHKVDGKWRIFDIVTEGSSLAKNYKSQFNRVIRKKGFDELLARMKKKLQK